MGTAFAGIVRVPLTSVIMIFEMTRDYSIIVPLMISNLVSFYISYRLQRHPIYEALALQDGIHLPSHAAQRATRQIRVRAAMRPPESTLIASMNPIEAIRSLEQTGVAQLPVTEGARFLGMLSSAELGKAAADVREIRELIDARFPHLHPDHDLSVALHRMGEAKCRELPVVSRRDIHSLEGVITLEDVLRFYGLDRTQPTDLDQQNT
jgi:CIC family chloride channel protein